MSRRDTPTVDVVEIPAVGPASSRAGEATHARISEERPGVPGGGRPLAVADAELIQS